MLLLLLSYDTCAFTPYDTLDKLIYYDDDTPLHLKKTTQ